MTNTITFCINNKNWHISRRLIILYCSISMDQYVILHSGFYFLHICIKSNNFFLFHENSLITHNQSKFIYRIDLITLNWILSEIYWWLWHNIPVNWDLNYDKLKLFYPKIKLAHSIKYLKIECKNIFNYQMI